MITMGEGSYCASNDIECYDIVDLTIGKYCSIASRLVIVSGQHPIVEHPEAVSQYPFYEQMHEEYWLCKNDGKVTIGNDVWVGQGVTILDSVTVGNGAVLAAYSVVTKDVPDYALVAGNPATIKKYRFTPEQIDFLKRFAWWDKTNEEVKEMIPYMRDIYLFIDKYGKFV